MKISVILPAYNVAEHLQNAVSSIFDTSYPDLEVIIIDDNSTDSTYKLAKSIREKHPEAVTLLKTAGIRNNGAGAARNVGISHATGEYITFLDADDWYLKNRFSACIDILRNNPDVDGVYEKTTCIYKDEREKIKMRYARELYLGGEHQQLVTKRLLIGSWSTNAITLRRRILGVSGWFNEDLPLGQDLELWLRLSCISTLVEGNATTPVAVYNRHGSNRYNPLEMDEHLIKVYEYILCWLKGRSQYRENRRHIEEHLQHLCLS